MSQRRKALKGHKNEGLSEASVLLNLAAREVREESKERVNK